MGVDITTASYTPAVFNVNKSTKSRYIVTSIEDFIVTWNLDAILSGQTEDTYNVKPPFNSDYPNGPKYENSPVQT